MTPLPLLGRATGHLRTQIWARSSKPAWPMKNSFYGELVPGEAKELAPGQWVQQQKSGELLMGHAALVWPLLGWEQWASPILDGLTGTSWTLKARQQAPLWKAATAFTQGWGCLAGATLQGHSSLAWAQVPFHGSWAHS